MTDLPQDEPAGPAEPTSAGTDLRVAREAAGLDLADIARATRVPQRHLEAIEAGNYAALPSPTYATGFVKAYAREVDLNEATIAAKVRAELKANPAENREYHPYETADPKRVPPRSLAWVGVLVAIVVVGLFGWWYANRDPLPPETAPIAIATPGPATPPGAAAGQAIGNATAAAVTPPAGAPVELVATAPVWVRITVAGGERLLEREMQAGERFTVPANAAEPTIRTGRPENLDVLVGGQPVAPLGPAGRPVGGIVVTAAALTARPAAPASVPTATAN